MDFIGIFYYFATGDVVAYTITGELPVKVKEMQVYLPRMVFFLFQFCAQHRSMVCFYGMPSTSQSAHAHTAVIYARIGVLCA